MKQKIVTYPSPSLKKAAEKVKFPLSKNDQSLVKDMWDTLAHLGVGLAAPQIGVSKQVCIIKLKDVETGSEAKNILMINPEISFYSELENIMVEGCLSFPDQYYKIQRPANIMVEYYNEKGKKLKLKAKKWLARVIQHEVDHLNGKLFINKGGLKMDPKYLEEVVD